MPPPVTTAPVRFARGFLIAQGALPLPVDTWVSDEIAGAWIARAPEVPLEVGRAGRHVVIVLGQPIHTLRADPVATGAQAAVQAAAEALARSEEAFLDETDAWSGRYLVLFGQDEVRHAMTDASGMRSAFHGLGGPFVLASHAVLAARALDAPMSPIVDAYEAILRARSRSLVMPMPGRSTPWSGVVHLTANVVLDMRTRQLRRIFPRRAVGMASPAEAAALIAPRLQAQVEALTASGRPIAFSLTAGVDSRVSLAASRGSRDEIRYFTYRRAGRSEDEDDVATASTMARELGLRYEVLDVEPLDPASDLAESIREATFLSHGHGIVAAYREAFRPDTIHVRSNVSEIGRCFYRRTRAGSTMTAEAARITAAEVARLWAGRRVEGPVVDAFEESMAATHLREATGFDVLDLIYWEHRMACWHSNVVLESDLAFDTHVLFDSRWILERMLSVPQEPRCRSEVATRLVAELWPELARFPTSTLQRRGAGTGTGTTRRRSLLGPIRRRIG